MASLGGYEKQYQVEIDPVRLQAYRISLADVVAAIRMSNGDVGGRVLEVAGHEYAIRGLGYITRKEDLEEIAVATDARGTPVRLRDIAKIQVGGNIRRGLAELDGEGEVVGGIVVMRYGENALEVIDRVKARIEELRPGFPPGVELVPTYDRAPLIRGSVRTLTSNLALVMVTVVLMIVLFLFHVRSALVAAITLPIAVALAFIPMYLHGHERQHHVARRHHHRRRRHGGLRRRAGGERPQEARARERAQRPHGGGDRGGARAGAVHLRRRSSSSRWRSFPSSPWRRRKAGSSSPSPTPSPSPWRSRACCRSRSCRR